MAFRVINVDVERRGKVKSTVAGPFPTRAGADAWRKREDPHSDISVGVEEIKKGESAFRDVVVGPVPSDTGRRLQRAREQKELAEQAQEKEAAGIPISTAEREAFRRSRFEVDGKIVTGAELGIQTQKETARIEQIRKEAISKPSISITPPTPKEFQQSLFARQELLAVLKTRPFVSTGLATALGIEPPSQEPPIGKVFRTQAGIVSREQVPTRFAAAEEKASTFLKTKAPRLALIKESLEPEAARLRAKRELITGKGFEETFQRQRLLAKERVLGFEKGVLNIALDKPLTFGTIFLGGAAFKILRTTLKGKKAKRTFDIQAGVGGATFLGVKSVQVAREKTPFARFEIVGEAATELSAFGEGFKAPSRAATAKTRFEESVIRETDIKFGVTLQIPSRVVGFKAFVQKPFARKIIAKKTGVKVSKKTPRAGLELFDIKAAKPTPKAPKEVFETIKADVQIVQPTGKELIIPIEPTIKTRFKIPKERLETTFQADLPRLKITPTFVAAETLTKRAFRVQVGGLFFEAVQTFPKPRRPVERRPKRIPPSKPIVELDTGALILKLKPPETKVKQKQRVIQKQILLQQQKVLQRQRAIQKQRVEILPKQKVFQRQRVDVLPKQKVIQKQKADVLLTPKIDLATGQRFGLLPKVLQIPKVRAKVSQRQKVAQDLGLGTPTEQIPIFRRPVTTRPTDTFVPKVPRVPKPPRRPPRRLPRDPPPKIPDLDLGFGRKPKKKKSKKGIRGLSLFPTRKTPSIVAAAFDIKGKFPKIVTGLEIRPLPLRRKK